MTVGKLRRDKELSIFVVVVLTCKNMIFQQYIIQNYVIITNDMEKEPLEITEDEKDFMR